MMKVGYMKRTMLFTCCALLVWSCAEEPLAPEMAPPLLSYSFFVAGHVYGSPAVDTVGIHPPLASAIPYLNERVGIELGVFTGDVVKKPSTASWEQLVIDLDLLNADSYIAPGNHDLLDIDLYREYIGDTQFNFNHKGDLFIILETTTTNWNVTTEKIAELKAEINSELEASSKVFVFCHQLLWYEEGTKYDACPPNSTQGKEGITDFFSEFLPMLNELDQEVIVYAGDLGAFENGCAVMYEEIDNVTLIGSGMGGGISDNVVITNVFETGDISFELIALNGDDKTKLGTLEDYRI